MCNFVYRLTVDDDGHIWAHKAVSNFALAANPEHINLDAYDGGASSKTFVVPSAMPIPLSTASRSLLADIADKITSLPLGTDIRSVKHLLTVYFLWSYPLFPVFSRRAFLDSFSSGGKYFSPCLLNVGEASH